MSITRGRVLSLKIETARGSGEYKECASIKVSKDDRVMPDSESWNWGKFEPITISGTLRRTYRKIKPQNRWARIRNIVAKHKRRRK